MAHKSPVDELVDGIDAIGTILDENLPAIKDRIAKLSEKQIDTAQTTLEIKRTLQTTDDIQDELKRAVTQIDGRLTEFGDTIEALIRRMDQLQKSMLELLMQTDNIAGGNSAENEDGVDAGALVSTIKAMDDRIKQLEGNRLINKNFKDRL